MGINSNNSGSNKRDEASGQKKQTPVQKAVSDTKRKAHDALHGKNNIYR